MQETPGHDARASLFGANARRLRHEIEADAWRCIAATFSSVLIHKKLRPLDGGTAFALCEFAGHDNTRGGERHVDT